MKISATRMIYELFTTASPLENVTAHELIRFSEEPYTEREALSLVSLHHGLPARPGIEARILKVEEAHPLDMKLADLTVRDLFSLLGIIEKHKLQRK